uniref:Uncharacterized protein n=1 Tax=Pseudoalteromonas rubra TaxID=43658 RepID=A0A0F4QW22_9GAMM|nr:hypothetical protein TW77_06080 [Pseudoalteromonas rubra]
MLLTVPQPAVVSVSHPQLVVVWQLQAAYLQWVLLQALAAKLPLINIKIQQIKSAEFFKYN